MPLTDFNQLQTGLMRPLRTTRLFTESTCPWVSTAGLSGHYDKQHHECAYCQRERQGEEIPR